MNSVIVGLALVLIALMLTRWILRERHGRRALINERTRSAAAVVIAAVAIAASQQQKPPPRDPPPDERRRQPSPPFGTPVATIDGGAPDGGSSMLAEEPSDRYAGELQAIDVEHTTEGFVVGAPLR